MAEQTVPGQTLQLVEYGKGYALFGEETRGLVEHLKPVAKFNPGLTLNGQRQAGWIVSKANLPHVEKLVADVVAGVVPVLSAEEVKAARAARPPRTSPTYRAVAPVAPVAPAAPAVLHGKRVQTLTYVVELPSIGQGARIIWTKDFATADYTVASLDGNVERIDSCLISDSDNNSYRLFVCRGKWQAQGVVDEHVVDFL